MLKHAFSRTLAFIAIIVLCGSTLTAQQLNRRQLRVVMYPFIPEYKSVFFDVQSAFEKQNPDIRLIIVDLSSNYYGPGEADYIGDADADVYELDSVFLRDFVRNGKIQPMPSGALLPPSDLLANADTGSTVDNTRYGAAHWVCGNFLFFRVGDGPLSHVRTLPEFVAVMNLNSHQAGNGLLVDLKGKLTLGEFYLETAFDHFGTWNSVSSHLASVDPVLQSNLGRLASMCDPGSCRNQNYHDSKFGIYPRQFARRNGRALVGYSESMHEALSESASSCTDAENCLSDKDIDVTAVPTDDAGVHHISWVDSFVLSKTCIKQCAADAVAFLKFMNSEDVYKQILLREGAAPAYLLPARKSLYSDPDLLKAAHLYPKLRALIENAAVPSAIHLNDELRTLGKTVDGNLH